MRETPNDIKNNNVDNNKEDFSYYSNKLKKVFNNLNDLKAAEKKEDEKEAVKNAAAAERKADAAKVENAYKALSKAIADRKEKVKSAQKEYLKKQAELKKGYEDLLESYDAEVDELDEAYAAELKAFTKKHGDFHTTFKDGDSTVTISNHTSKSLLGDFWGEMFDFLLNL